MKRLLGMVMVLAVGLAGVAAGQEMGLFRSPVFVAQPGLIKSFSPGDGLDFNARFVTALPTSINRLTIVGIIQWTPFADENGDGAKENTPAFVYGPVVNLINTSSFSFDIDGLFAYSPSGSVPQNSAYTHKFLVEGDFFLKLGSMMNARGHWSSLSLYALLAYVFTGLDDGVGSGPGGAVESKDRMVLLTGLSLPLAPWKK
ncbi:MAG: hypothetical protein ACREMW_15855 [Gemmatimonadales bacterium]